MNLSIIFGNAEWWLSVSSSLIGAFAGGALTYFVGSIHLSKQLDENKESRKSDYIIRKLEYNRNQLLEIKSETQGIYNKIYHEAEYRRMIIDDKYLVYDEKTNIVLFKDVLPLLYNYELLDEKMNNNKSRISRVRQDISTIINNEFYSKLKILNTYELKIYNLKGEVNKSKESLNPVTIELMFEGLNSIERFIDIINEDLNYVNGRLIHEEYRL